MDHLPDCSGNTAEKGTERTLTVKYLSGLLFLHLASFIISLITYLPIADGWSFWLQRTINVGAIVCLFFLSSVSIRYRKAAFFKTAVFCCTLLTSIIPLRAVATILSLLSFVCSVISTWQEFHGHAELVEPFGEKLSRGWRYLFWWEIVLGVLSSIVAMVVTVLISVWRGEIMAIANLISIIPVILNDVLSLVYLMLLVLTIRVLKSI